MPTVEELTAIYENFMLAPRHGPGVCRRCLNLTAGYDRCYACDHMPSLLAAVVPISYSVAGEQLHHALAGYKRRSGAAARRLELGIAAVLWRFLARHEGCVARAAGVASFPVVTIVPSSNRSREGEQRLRAIVGELVMPTRQRFQAVLQRSEAEADRHEFNAEKYQALRPFEGEPVLLIDDTWTTGANAQSAAAALLAAGSGPVAAVAVGRHVNRRWRANDEALRALPAPFDWTNCVVCSAAALRQAA